MHQIFSTKADDSNSNLPRGEGRRRSRQSRKYENIDGTPSIVTTYENKTNHGLAFWDRQLTIRKIVQQSSLKLRNLQYNYC